MITASDFIHLPYSPDLTEGGIAYACRSLNYTCNRMGGSPYARLRRIVGGVALELAFRHHLTSQSVPFDVKGATPFTEPDRYDVSLGGHRGISSKGKPSRSRESCVPVQHHANQEPFGPRREIESAGGSFGKSQNPASENTDQPND